MLKKPEKIVIHWTAGNYAASFYDKQFYHFLIDGESKVHDGIYAPEANLDVSDGKYCAHCGGGNTGAIGVALCGMAGYKNPHEIGRFPLKAKQVETAFLLCARLCKKYGIPVDEKHVMTHYEFGRKNPNTSSFGKIDITFLPPYPEVKQENVGGFFRQKIKWYYGHLTGTA